MILLLGVLFLFGTAESFGEMSAAQIQDVLFWHNKARSDIAKSGRCGNMLEMEWDTDVATAAQTNECPISHNGVASQNFAAGRLGENLAWSSNICGKGGMCAEAGACGKNGVACESCANICTFKNRAYMGWYQKETTDPNSSTDNCLSYANGGGHCTQMVWQNSNKLGCSYQSGCSRWGTTLNCNYFPGGNINVGGGGVKIGNCKTGPACSSCPTTHPHCSTGENSGLCSRFESSDAAAAKTVLGDLAPASIGHSIAGAVAMPLILVALAIPAFLFREKVLDAVGSKLPCAKMAHPAATFVSSTVVFALALVACISSSWTVVTGLSQPSTVNPWTVCPYEYDCSDLLGHTTTSEAAGFVEAARTFLVLNVLLACSSVVLSGMYMRRDTHKLRMGILGCLTGTFVCNWIVLGLWYGFANDHLPAGATSFGWAGGLLVLSVFLTPCAWLFAWFLGGVKRVKVPGPVAV